MWASRVASSIGHSQLSITPALACSQDALFPVWVLVHLSPLKFWSQTLIGILSVLLPTCGPGQANPSFCSLCFILCTGVMMMSTS